MLLTRRHTYVCGKRVNALRAQMKTHFRKLHGAVVGFGLGLSLFLKVALPCADCSPLLSKAGLTLVVRGPMHLCQASLLCTLFQLSIALTSRVAFTIDFSCVIDLLWKLSVFRYHQFTPFYQLRSNICQVNVMPHAAFLQDLSRKNYPLV